MADIFISYASADRERAETLARALESQGWSVWWDRDIPTGKTLDEVLEEALDPARCVIVLWSKRSISSKRVRTEAQKGMDRETLVPILVEDVKIPLPFRDVQATNLIGWDGEETATSFQSLLTDLVFLVGFSPKQPPQQVAGVVPAAVAGPAKERGLSRFVRLAPWIGGAVAVVAVSIIVVPRFVPIGSGTGPSQPISAGMGEPPTADLSAQPGTVELGISTTLSWETTNATEVRLEPGIGAVEPRGSRSVSPERDVVYRLIADGSGGTVEDSVRVRVTAPAPVPTASLQAQPVTVERGQSTTLSWATTNATDVRLEPGLGRVDARGSVRVSPERDANYRLIARGAGGTVEDSVRVRVTAPAQAPVPTASLQAQPGTVELGRSTTLSWETTNATEVRLEPGIGAVEPRGSRSVSPERDVVYRLIAGGSGGTVEDVVRVAVTEPRLSAGDTFSDCSGCPEMVVIPAGRFTMGSPDSETERDSEGPRFEVRIPRDFALGKYEVTRAEYAAFAQETGLDASGCHAWERNRPLWTLDDSANWRNPGFSQTEGDPVVCVSWDDAEKYVRWLNQKTGQEYRLPSESEWEYAARARTTTARYWGESPDRACEYANVADLTAKDRYFAATVHECRDGYVYTAPAGSFGANSFGLNDMLGNAWEWVEDCWHDTYAGAPADGTAWTAGRCSRRVRRGGSWSNAPGLVRSAVRYNIGTAYRASNNGFRVARTLP